MSHKESPTIGLVGAGGISRSHLPALLEQAKEVLVFSEEGAPELVRDFAQTTDTPLRAVNTFAQLLDASDVVDVVTPTNTHYPIVRAALEAGRDVISEKPLTRTDSDARDLVEIARSAGVRLIPAHVVRYFPEYAALKAAVDGGELGDIAVLRFTRSGAHPRNPWFSDTALSGGLIMDQMIHDLDQARWIAGEIRTVYAARTRTTAAGQPVEAAHVILTHNSGAITECSGVWGPQGLPFTTSYSAAGSRGTLSHSSAAERGYIAEITHPARTKPDDGFLPDIDPVEDPYTLEIRDYLRSFRDGEPARLTASDGLQAVRIANAALRSIETGQPVELTDDVPAAEKGSQP